MINNGKMYNKVMDKLNFQPGLNASDITISIQGDQDIVILAGKVRSFAEKDMAEKAVKSLSGVKTVANDITVDIYAKYKKTDAEIAQDVTRAIKSSWFTYIEEIKSVVKDGNVTLSGEVSWNYQKNQVFNLVKNLIGIKSIINNISVKPSITIDPKNVREEITKEFERHARIDADKIKIEVDGTRVILSGRVSTFDELDEAEDAAWSIKGVTNVENNLHIF